jgi:CheY-like chemotaxis protein
LEEDYGSINSFSLKPTLLESRNIDKASRYLLNVVSQLHIYPFSTIAKKFYPKLYQAKANLPVVAITGNAKNYSDTDFKEAGFNDALMKPLNFDRLVEVVKGLTE